MHTSREVNKRGRRACKGITSTRVDVEAWSVGCTSAAASGLVSPENTGYVLDSIFLFFADLEKDKCAFVADKFFRRDSGGGGGRLGLMGARRGRVDGGDGYMRHASIISYGTPGSLATIGMQQGSLISAG